MKKDIMKENDKSLNSKNFSIDYKVNPNTGEAYVSIRATSKLIGVPESTIRHHLKVAHKNYDRSQGLTPEILSKVTHHFALKKKAKANKLLDKLAEAGAKAFIYHKAGYSINAATTPLTYKESLKRLLAAEEEREKLVNVITNQSQTIKEDNVKMDKSDEYLSVKKVRKMNPGKTISGRKLVEASEEMDIPVETLYSSYEDVTINTYHYTVWEEVYPDLVLYK